MTIYYSPSTTSFWDSNINNLSKIPNDKIEITSDYRFELVEGLNSGGTISINELGQPVITPRSESDTLLVLAENYRLQRNSLLKSSDWTQLPDAPNDTKTAWATYRQALRDLPQQQDFPNNVTWPTAPQ
jgi:hypothetical protein